MLISESLNAAINKQIGEELGNSHQYLAIASYFEAEGLSLLAKVYAKQSDEERDHAQRFIKFVQDAGGRVLIPSVAEPRNEFRSAEDAVKHALDYELKTTRQIYDLLEMAAAEKSHVAVSALQWFVTEQLEEVSSAERRLAIVKRAGPSVLMVEAYLAHLEA